MVKWWEMLDWNKMENSWWKLRKEVRYKIRKAGLAPRFDVEERDNHAV